MHVSFRFDCRCNTFVLLPLGSICFIHRQKSSIGHRSRYRPLWYLILEFVIQILNAAGLRQFQIDHACVWIFRYRSLHSQHEGRITHFDTIFITAKSGVESVSYCYSSLWSFADHIDIVRMYCSQHMMTFRRYELEHRLVAGNLLACPTISIEVFDHPFVTHLSVPARSCWRSI